MTFKEGAGGERRDVTRPRPSVGISLAIFCVSAGLMGYLRLVVFPNQFITLTYGLPLLLCLWHRDRVLLWGMAGIFTLMAAVKAFWLMPDPDPNGLWEAVQWLMQTVNIVVIAGTVEAVLRLSQRLRRQNEDLEELNAELAASEEEVRQQNEEIQQQQEELNQQNEELNQQNVELRETQELLEQRAGDLEEANRDLDAREGMLDTILESLRGTENELQVLNRVCQALVKVAGEQAVAAAVVERIGGDELRIRAHSGLQELWDHRWPFKSSFAAIAIAEGRTCFVDDLAARRDLTVLRGAGREFRSLLATPLRVGAETIGALEVFAFEPGPWTERQFRLIEWSAAQCRRALETMLLQENLRRGRELSEAANRVGQVLHGRLETREIIRQIVDEGASALGSETAAISERVEGGWVVRHVHGLPAELVGAQMTDQTEHHAVMAIKSGDVLPVEDAFNDDRFNQEHLRKHNVRSVLVAPLIMQGRPFGVVFFNYHSNRHAFTEAEVGFARQVAATAASALENARLFEERVKAEQALAESKKRVEVLARAASVLLRAEDPQAVLEELCCEVRCFLGCDVFFNFLLDGAQRKLKLNACGGVDHRIARVVEGLELCESLCGSAAETGARVVARDVDRSDDTRAAVVKRLGIRAYAAHPLLGAKGEVLGTVSFGTRERGSFTAEDLELMKAVADHVAVALVKKRAEEALRTANQRLEYHVQNTPLAVIEFDAALRVSTWNDGAQRVFGWDAAEVVGRPMCDIPWIPEEDQARVEGVAAALVSGQTIRSVNINRNLRKDGKEIWCEWHNSSLTDPSGKMQSIQSLILDVTVSREAQAVLTRDKAELERLVRERTAKLEELVAELEHFSYSITHDMRAPLRGMQGFAEAMTEACLGCQRNDSLGFMKRIRTSASRMDLLITDALQYAKAVRKELPLGPVDTGELLRGMLDSYPELQRSKAKIELRGELPVVMGNEAGLTQVFSNLLGNAVKFVRPGQVPEICVWAEVLVRGSQPERQQADSKRPRGYQALNSPDVAGGGGRDGQQGGGAILETDRWVRIWVEDNGIGILPMMKSKVFDMFARGHDGEQYEGTGIGLALVRKVAQRMGGRVGVESEPGKGSRFWVELRDGRTQGM